MRPSYEKRKKLKPALIVGSGKARRNERQEILPTQQYRTKKNVLTEDFKAECVEIFREKSKQSALGIDGLMLVCRQVQKFEKYSANSEVQKLSISTKFAENLAKNFELVRTYRSSNADNFTEFELQNFRDGLMVQLGGVDPKLILNADEVGVNYNAVPKSAIRHKDDKFKVPCDKKRLTLFPYLSFMDKINFRPAIIGDQQGRRWTTLLSRSQETVTVKVDAEERTLTRYYCRVADGDFMLYVNPTSWMNSSIFMAECDSLSRHLATNYPGRKYILLVDNFAGHPSFNSASLKTIFLPARTTSVLQPADVLFNAVLKKASSRGTKKL